MYPTEKSTQRTAAFSSTSSILNTGISTTNSATIFQPSKTDHDQSTQPGKSILIQYFNIGLDKHFLGVKLLILSYPSVLSYVLGAQKNRFIETVLLSTHKICFG